MKNFWRVTAAGCFLTLAACQAPAVVAGVAASSGVAAGTIASGLTLVDDAVTAGQLFCATKGEVVGLLDAATNKPLLATGQTSAFVNAACNLIGGLPVVPPATTVPTVAVVAPVVSVPAAS